MTPVKADTGVLQVHIFRRRVLEDVDTVNRRRQEHRKRDREIDRTGSSFLSLSLHAIRPRLAKNARVTRFVTRSKSKQFTE